MLIGSFVAKTSEGDGPPAAGFVLSREARVLLVAAAISAALLPAIPDSLSVPTIAFVGLFVLFCLASARDELRLRRRPATAGFPLALFFLCAAGSLITASWNGVSTPEWFRAAVPFAFLATYFVVPDRLTGKDAHFTMASLQLSAVVWLIASLLPAIPALRGGGIERLTHLGFQFLLPYGLIGLVTALFLDWPPLYRVVSSGVFTVVIVATAYRSQFLIAAAIWLVYIARQRHKLLAGSALLLTGVLAYGALRDSVFLDAFVQRFTVIEDAAQSPRAREIEYALESFRRSPVVGNGLGFHVPVSVNEFEPATGAMWVPYTHNVWAYLLMDLGIAGLFCYVVFFAGALCAGFTRHRFESAGFAAALLLGSLLLYFTVEAAFRQIQTNLVVAMLAVVLTKSFPGDQSRGTLNGTCAGS